MVSFMPVMGEVKNVESKRYARENRGGAGIVVRLSIGDYMGA
jgi:hypothetical protein